MGIPIPDVGEGGTYGSETGQSGTLYPSATTTPGSAMSKEHMDSSGSISTSMDGAGSGESRPRLIRTDHRSGSNLRRPVRADSPALGEGSERQRQTLIALTRRSDTLSHPARPILPLTDRTHSIPASGSRPPLRSAATSPVRGLGSSPQMKKFSKPDWIFHGQSRSDPDIAEHSPSPPETAIRRASGPAISRPYHQVIHSGRIRA